MNWYDEEFRILDLQHTAHRQEWSEAAPAPSNFERRRALYLSPLLNALGIRLVKFGYWLQARTQALPSAPVPPVLPARTANNGPAC